VYGPGVNLYTAFFGQGMIRDVDYEVIDNKIIISFAGSLISIK
jgi:hypothetical protein